jgi:hypothetical protein
MWRLAARLALQAHHLTSLTAACNGTVSPTEMAALQLQV